VTGPLTAEQLDRLVAYGRPAEVAVGDVLFRAGATDVDLIVVESAAVALDPAPAAGVEQVYGPGEVIGELVMLTGHGAEHGARVVRAGTIHRLTSPALRQVLATEGDLAEQLLTTFLARRRLARGQAAAHAAVEIIGPADSPVTQALRTYAGRDGVRHTWLDPAGEAGSGALAAAGLDAADLPAVLGPHGAIPRATPADLSTLGRGSGTVDVVIVGAGAAGLAAAVQCGVAGLSTVVVDQVGPGGQAARSQHVRHLLGFPAGLTGTELMTRLLEQARDAGAKLVGPCEVVALDRVDARTIQVELSDTSRLSARAVIVASGARYPVADEPGWQEFTVRGVYFAVTEAAARVFVGRPVIVVGDSADAARAAVYLADSGCETLLLRSGDDRAATLDHTLVDRLARTARLTLWSSAHVSAFHGDDVLTAVTVTRAGVDTRVETAAVFGLTDPLPNAGFVRGAARDGKGFLRTGENLGHDDLGAAWTTAARRPLALETSLPGIFAVGDIRAGAARLVRDALADGSVVARMVARVVSDSRGESPQVQ
jgi:thioredoxin reductase (NADPH)